ncbi:MAG: hypothetical protein NTV93_04850 [Verrucomicrobia bacterium]|nr:hypothetical protein [Verrucomicrobiota bacterium]
MTSIVPESAATPATAEPKAAPAPSAVGLADGFKGGRVGMDIEVVPGSSGRSLHLTLVNKNGTELKVSVPAGELAFEADLSGSAIAPDPAAFPTAAWKTQAPPQASAIRN